VSDPRPQELSLASRLVESPQAPRLALTEYANGDCKDIERRAVALDVNAHLAHSAEGIQRKAPRVRDVEVQPPFFCCRRPARVA
jgi:hypothetical protein